MGRLKEIRYMKNFEWIIKNYDRIVKPINKTVGYLFNNLPCYFFKKEHISSSYFIKWLNTEASKGNNRLFDDVQKD